MMKYKPMLARPVGSFERITTNDWHNGLYIQPKLDGVRCLIQCDGNPAKRGIVAYSRTSKEWKNINHILEQLIPFFIEFPNTVLDGELYNHDLKNDFEKIISLVRKTKPTDKDRLESAEKVQFHCYDLIEEIETSEVGDDYARFEYRNYFLKKNLDNRFPSIKTLPYGLVFNTEEVEVMHDLQKAAGYEGSILRKNAPYECKRSWTLQKVKDFSDAEAKIIGWAEGKGKRVGTIGKFQAVDTDGNEFGMPVMDKFKYLQDNFKVMRGWVGKTATFTYFERTKANSYRHPLFKCIRNYE